MSRARRARVTVSVTAVLAALALLVLGCASPSGDPPSTAAVPLPPGVTAEMGVDGGGRFYLFTSPLEPDLALVAYAITLEQAGYAPAGTERGWTLFTGERGRIAVRAEPGPPTQILVRELATEDAPPPEDPGQSATTPSPGAQAYPVTPGAGPSAGAGAPGASPSPMPTETPDAKPGRRPDPPHGSVSGIGGGNAGGQGQGQGDGQNDPGGQGQGQGDGQGQGQGDGQNDPGGQGQGQGQGDGQNDPGGQGQGQGDGQNDPGGQGQGSDKPEATPRPTKTPKP